MASHRVYVIGVRGKDKGATHKEKERLEEEMVDQHCCAEKQAAALCTEASKSVFVEQFHFF